MEFGVTCNTAKKKHTKVSNRTYIWMQHMNIHELEELYKRLDLELH